jgi:hypothetical protein
MDQLELRETNCVGVTVHRCTGVYVRVSVHACDPFYILKRKYILSHPCTSEYQMLEDWYRFNQPHKTKDCNASTKVYLALDFHSNSMNRQVDSLRGMEG